ncbi:MAG: hypothetical protein NC453_22895 [Muribaculum sp.]|nr:hypothetical protein [Muribaculum sp.]
MKINSFKSISVLLVLSCLFFNILKISAQSNVESNPLDNTTWIVEVPQDKGYSTVLNFSDNVYTNTFSYNGESCTVKKIYSITFSQKDTRGSNNSIGKIKIANEKTKNNTLVDQFEIIEISNSKLVLKNIQTGAIINCVKKLDK